MTDARRIVGWAAVLLALAAAAFVAWFVLHEAAPPVPPDTTGAVVRRDSEPAPPPGKPVISVPLERKPPPAPEPPAPASTGAVTGRVVGPDRRPRGPARIEALQGGITFVPGVGTLQALGRRAQAEDDGRFTLQGLLPMDNLILRLDGADFAPTQAGPFGVVAGRTSDIGDLIVSPGMAITGTVLDLRAAPVQGARVGLFQDGLRAPGEEPDPDALPEPALLVLTDARGRFRIPNANASTFMLHVTAAGFANTLVSGGPLPGEQLPVVDLQILLQPTHPLRGRVVDAADDRPLPGARVRADPLAPGGGRSEARTGADGSFLIEDLSAGNYSLSATVEGYSRGLGRVFGDQPDAEIVLRLEAQGSLTGVVLGSDGEPVRAFDLQPRYRKQRRDPAVPRGRFQRITAADGSFTIQGLDAGFWSVDVWAKGYALTSSDLVRVKQGQSASGLVITLLRGATLDGLVLDTEGRPVSGAEVSLHPNHEPEIAFLRDTAPLPGASRPVRTDAEGRFSIPDLMAQSFQVQVDHPDFAILRRNDVTLTAEQSLEAAPFVLQRGGIVRGAALDGSGAPVAGATVNLNAQDGTGQQTVSDARGQFVFTRVREGDYQLLCYGKQLSLGAMLASIGNPPPVFHVPAGGAVQQNAYNLE